AEDGIRDLIVTGVQTCALPISTRTLDPSNSATVSLTTTANTTHLFIRTTSLFTGDRPVAANAFIRNYSPSASGAVLRTDFAAVKIGRASCRERGDVVGGGGTLE